MRIRLFMPLVFVLSFMLLACQQTETKDAQPKLAVVDMARIMRDSEPGKAGVKFLESLQSGMQEKLNAIQARLEKDPKDEAAQKELQGVYMASQQRMQAEQQNVVNLLYDTIQRVLNAYREQQGYDIILSAEVAAAFNPKADVTAAVIAEVNKQKIDFKPLPEPAAPEAAPAPAAQPQEKEQPKEQPKADAPENGKKK
ncbi:OmpH family outer membrane protein [Desulfovibrio sp. PG-178-WT-4]|uniref:OmpH family outer membrane protein n=1 Tax=Desulfovibrio porci TaxID=2605782 RepID=A0A6L5XJ04_9BACT|nr:OmpH family outer membrane protein [Desulfovibrio porci]MDY3809358.1 OmpH family outer membrane protein [Desulfovibrio porci]MSS27049.1 OmpH family outer membrane protein [Desulfovibrio porci]